MGSATEEVVRYPDALFGQYTGREANVAPLLWATGTASPVFSSFKLEFIHGRFRDDVSRTLSARRDAKIAIRELLDAQPGLDEFEISESLDLEFWLVCDLCDELLDEGLIGRDETAAPTEPSLGEG